MKKNMIFGVLGMGAMLFAACSQDKELYDQEEATKEKEAQFSSAFIQKYGQIEAGQDWGFGDVQSTRAANPNSNQWASFVTVPSAITASENTEVTKWFKEHRNPISVSINWADFFVQHVSSSHGNMDKLVAGYSGKDDHVNNFNAASGSIMLMQNSGTSSFGYNNSKDGKMHYKYAIQYINGSYYVGFDFEATGQNSNQKETADGYYADWIVKIFPANYLNAKRIIAEDLGATDDFDFNDVVFDVAFNGGATIITLQAAGGTLPLYIGVGSVQHEVHSLFGVSSDVMVNTGLYNAAPVVFRLPICNSANDVKILVKDQTVGLYLLKAESGKAPQKISVPTTYGWTKEREAIDSKYPKFKNWVGNKAIDWLN